MPATRSATATARSSWTIPCGERVLVLGTQTRLMGVVNVTPDSFSDGSKYLDARAAVEHALALEAAGADLLDIGGESTRPGAAPVAAKDELRRVLPVITALVSRLSIPLSIDTSKAVVARECLAAGASLVNDVTALRGDPAMAEVVAAAQSPVILMHMAGTPRTMQHDPHYDDVVADVRAFLAQAIARAIERGVDRERILVDPGIGFGKTVAHNLALLAGLPAFSELDRPIVVGPSRKSFLGQLLDRPVEARLWGTAGAVAVAAWRGASVVRVHDVTEMRDVLRIVDAIALETSA